jgi:hypothetical protein
MGGWAIGKDITLNIAIVPKNTIGLPLEFSDTFESLLIASLVPLSLKNVCRFLQAIYGSLFVASSSQGRDRNKPSDCCWLYQKRQHK